MNKSRILTTSAAVLLTLPATAPAIDYHWIADPPIETNNWGDTTNWLGGNVPVSGGGNRIFIHTGSSINVLGPALDAGLMILAIGNAGDPASGYTFGAGTYNVGTIFIGENRNLNDGTANIHLTNGYGRGFINSGTTINVGAFHLGEWDGASGHVVQSGGDVNISGQFRLGHWPQGGAKNSYTMNGGTITMTAPAGNPLSEGVAGNVILGIDSSGTFNMNAGVFTAHGITMQTRSAGGGESVLNMNGGTLNIGVNGFTTSNPGVLTSYDINLGGGTIRSTANWSSGLEMHLVTGGTGVIFDTNGFNVALNGVLNGADGLTKINGGRLTLGGASTYTGATTINAGTLHFSSAGSSPFTDITIGPAAELQIDTIGKTLQSLTLQGDATLALPAVLSQTTTVTNTLDFANGANFTVVPGFFAAPNLGETFDLFTAGSIVGTPASIVTDFGLSHASGVTQIVGNKLVLTITTAGGLLTWSNGQGTGNWVTNGDVNFTGADGIFLNNDQVTFGDTAAGTVNMIGTLLPSAVIVNASADYTFSGTGFVSGVTGLTKSGTGTLTLGSFHDYTGGTTVNGGVLNLVSQNVGMGTIRGTVTVNAGAELRATGASGAIFGYTAGQKLDVFNINGGLVNTVGGVNHIWNATVNMTGGELRVNGGVSSPTGDYYEWGNSTLNTFASADTAIVSGRLRVRADAGATLNINVADGPAAVDLEISAAITTQNGNINLNKNGPGAATLSGGMQIGGLLLPNAGTLTLSGGAPFSAGNLRMTADTTTTLTNNAALTVNSFEAGVNGVNDTLGGTLNVGPGTSLTVQNNFTLGNTFGSGAEAHGILHQTGGTVTVNAPNTDGRNFVLGHWNQGRGTYNLSAGTLNSTGISMAVSWDGEGTFNLSGTGIANVLGLRFGHNGGRTGVFNLTGGTLNLGAEGIWEQFAGLPNDINLGGGTIRAATNTNIFLPVELTGIGGDVTFDTNGNTLTLSGLISGSGGFVKNGPGRMILNAGNTATGIFVVNEGVLAAQGGHSANRIPAGGIVQINNGGTFEFSSVNPTSFTANYIIGAGGVLTNAVGVDHAHVGSVLMTGGTWTTDPGAIAFDGENYQLEGTVTVSGSVPSLITQQGGTGANRGIAWVGLTSFNVANVTGDDAPDLTVSTELENANSGAAALEKQGFGTMNVTFANSYTGGTSIKEGTLAVNNSTGSGTGTGNVTVDPSGRLSGTGTVGVGGSTIVAVLGQLAPGNSAGTLTFNLGSGTLLIGGINLGGLEFELGAVSDKVQITTGSLNIGSGGIDLDAFSFSLLGGFANGDYLLFDTNQPIIGTLGPNVSGSLGGGFIGTLQFADGGNDLILQVVPEPGSALLLLLGGLGIAATRRRV